MSNNNQSATKLNFCTIQLKTTTDKFVWKIDNFAEWPEKCGEYLQSTEFTSTAPDGQLSKWRMQIYPNGCKEEFKDYVSLFLHLIDSNNGEVEAKYQISIHKPNGDEFKLIEAQEDYLKFGFGRIPNGTANDKLIKREVLLNEENGYLDGDRLTIVCELTLQQNLVEAAQLPDIEVPECRMQEDVSHLFETGQFADCKIIADDGKKEFKTHKCILGCRSPVFAAMFQHEMVEKNNNEVKITDVKGDVIEKMLRFIYSGKEPDCGRMTEDLLIAADKYGLTRLKLLCERKLIIFMWNTNACALLTLANLYRAEHLKIYAMDYIKKNLKEVMKSDGWKNMANEQLKEQILEAIAK